MVSVPNLPNLAVVTVLIKDFMTDKGLYAKMSANVQKVFEEMFDADKIYEKYAEHIERVAYELP